MATFLLSRFQFVLLGGMLLLIAVSKDVRKRIRLFEGSRKLRIFTLLVLFALIGNLLYLFDPHRFYFGRTLTPLIISPFFLYNWQIFGFSLIGVGMILNSLVILVNGLRMPILPMLFDSQSSIYVPISENTLFPWLGDIFIIEDWYSTYAFSLGDILIYTGGLIAVFHLMYVALSGTLSPKERGG